METVQPKLRFPEFNGNWDDFILGKIAKFSKGKGISKSDISENGKFECIRYGELYTIYGETISNIVSKTDLDSKELIFSSYNDIIIPASGETQLDIATASCVLKEGVALGGDLNIIKTDNNGVFLSYYLNNSKKEDIASLAQGVSVVHLYSSQLSTLNLNLPPIEEQTKIANFLSAVDEKLNLLKEKKSLLEEYKKGIMQKIFNQELKFKDDNGEDFEEWKKKKLGDIIVFLADYTANGSFKSLKDNVQYYNDENYAALVRTTDLEKKIFKPERFTDKKGYDFLKKTSLFGNELVLANVGSIGKVYKVPEYDKPMTLAPNTYTIRFNETCDLDFYFQWMLSIEFKHKLLSMVGSSTLKAINKSNLRDIDTFLPSLKEQTKIANFLSAIDEKIDLVSNQIQDTQEYKKGLLQQMFV